MINATYSTRKIKSSRRMPKNFIQKYGKKKQIMVKETARKDSIEKFCKGIWGEGKACIMSASWIGSTERESERVNEQEWKNMTALKLKAAMTNFKKWKSPGNKKVPNFSLNGISLSNVTLTILLNEIMQNP